MPSRLTHVPGSHGPRHSGSVMTPTLQVSIETFRVSGRGPPSRMMVVPDRGADILSLETRGVTERCCGFRRGDTGGVLTGDGRVGMVVVAAVVVCDDLASVVC